jgi:hypothetical protein
MAGEKFILSIQVDVMCSLYVQIFQLFQHCPESSYSLYPLPQQFETGLMFKQLSVSAAGDSVRQRRLGQSIVADGWTGVIAHVIEFRILRSLFAFAIKMTYIPEETSEVSKTSV